MWQQQHELGTSPFLKSALPNRTGREGRNQEGREGRNHDSGRHGEDRLGPRGDRGEVRKSLQR